jgi:hypothetical protein
MTMSCVTMLPPPATTTTKIEAGSSYEPTDSVIGMSLMIQLSIAMGTSGLLSAFAFVNTHAGYMRIRDIIDSFNYLALGFH